MPEKHPLIILRSMLEHKNIVELLGYCQEYMDVKIPKENATEGTVPAKEEFLLLVEEYMTNGNLGNLICGTHLKLNVWAYASVLDQFDPIQWT